MSAFDHDFELFGAEDTTYDRQRASISPPLPELIPSSPYTHALLQRSERSASLPVESLPNAVRKRALDRRGWSGSDDGVYSQADNVNVKETWAEQEAMLERTREDLRSVQLDARRGPVQQFGSAFPTASIGAPQSPTLYGIRQQATEQSEMRRTVSPQEAFLDYDDVEERLHSSARSGASLFAPLPSTYRAHPQSAPAPPPSLPATTLVHGSPRTTHRPIHPLQNAVSWADKQVAVEEDDETSGIAESSDGDEIETPPLSIGGPTFPVSSAFPAQPMPFQDDEDVVQSIPPVDEDEEPYVPPVFVTTATSFIRRRSRTPTLSHVSPPFQSTERSTYVESDDEEATPEPQEDGVASIASAEIRPSDDDEEYRPESGNGGAESDGELPVPYKSSSSGGRKRSRTPAALDDDDDSEDFSSSTASPPASRRRSGSRPPASAPSKRRKQSSGITSAPGTIPCPFVSSDGRACGVVFRRPYDLARHKETIHGDGTKKKPAWVCSVCQGTFSRKDALLRHCRIRSHKSTT